MIVGLAFTGSFLPTVYVHLQVQSFQSTGSARSSTFTVSPHPADPSAPGQSSSRGPRRLFDRSEETPVSRLDRRDGRTPPPGLTEPVNDNGTLYGIN